MKSDKIYNVKLIDELGNCFYEKLELRFRDKNRFVKDWLFLDSYTKCTIGDITVFRKDNGQEIWVYECND